MTAQQNQEHAMHMIDAARELVISPDREDLINDLFDFAIRQAHESRVVFLTGISTNWLVAAQAGDEIRALEHRLAILRAPP